MKRKYSIGVIFFGILGALGVGSSLLQKRAIVEAAAVQAPRFEVDPMWPKPLPNHWVMGSVIGVSVDSSDHIWIIHREGSLETKEKYATWSPAASECCVPAPPILEFNEAGDLIGHWGGPGQGYDWPSSNHGIDVDYKGNVWIGGNGRGGQPAPLPGDESRMGTGVVHDSMVLKFTQSGKLPICISNFPDCVNFSTILSCTTPVPILLSSPGSGAGCPPRPLPPIHTFPL